MSWRTVVVSNSAKLDYQMGYMIVRAKETTQIFINEIHTLILETPAVSITAALLSELTKQKVKVIFCDEKRNPSSELIPYYGSFDTSGKIRNQIKWDKDIKTAVWTEIVSEKIHNQCLLLKERNLPEWELLDSYINEIKYGDDTNREGHAAKVYFNALFGLGFTRTEDCNENAALNYGYTILLSTFNREITANGYLTQLGLFHDNHSNPFNLASDLMEPFRPLVDRIVVDMVLNEFGHDEKMKLLSLLDIQVKINGRDEYVRNAIKIYCKTVFDAIEDLDVSLIKFYSMESKQ